MKAFVFPGQGAQFVGMGKDLYDNNPLAKQLFEKANDILGYRITDIMFEGTDEDLRQTKVTQPAVFLHSVISALCMGENFNTAYLHAVYSVRSVNLQAAFSVSWIGRVARLAACSSQTCFIDSFHAAAGICGVIAAFYLYIMVPAFNCNTQRRFRRVPIAVRYRVPERFRQRFAILRALI